VISNTKVLLKRAAHRIPGLRDRILRDRIRALPRQINMADLFTGTGCFNKMFATLFDAIQNTYPEECEDLEVIWFDLSITFSLEHIYSTSDQLDINRYSWET
jgi:hypothetical protein